MKKNLTLALPEDLLRRARILAVHEGTTVNEMVRGLLESHVGGKDRVAEAVEDLIRLGRESGGEWGGRKWTREELHDRKRSRGR